MFAALHAGDVDAEIERLDCHRQAVEQVVTPSPRPLSPTRLQPVMAPEVENPEIPDREELLRIRAEIPRALKRRGSVDVSKPMKKASHYQPNQYKTIIHKLFHKRAHHHKGEKGSDSSSDGDEPALPPAALPPVIPEDQKVRSYFLFAPLQFLLFFYFFICCHTFIPEHESHFSIRHR